MEAAGNKKTVRTCVACGTSSAKGELVRFVRSKDGVVSCDASGRATGRGAYLCAKDACFAKAAKQGRLERALKCQLSATDYQCLEKAFRAISNEKASK